MRKKGFFFSLKWKLAYFFGTVFLLLNSFFSYFVYLDAKDDFILERKNIQQRYSNVANALAEDSFLVLEQFAELFSLNNTLSNKVDDEQAVIIEILDRNWQKGQFVWGAENAAFFNKDNELVRLWGIQLPYQSQVIESVIKSEMPTHLIICTEICYQQVIIPILGDSDLVGVFTITRSFDNSIIQYQHATGSDIGILIPQKKAADPGIWPYQLSVMTDYEHNIELFKYLSKNHSFDEFLENNKIIKFGDKSYEVSIIPIDQGLVNSSPYFLLIDNVTWDLENLENDLTTVWLYGALSLLFSLGLLILVLHLSLRRVVVLSNSLPLLAKQQYSEFRRIIGSNDTAFGYDELDKLNHTALTLTSQLEHLEQEVRENALSLMDKTQALATERDFIHQLVEVAPIIIITQDLNGQILTVNQVGMDQFGADSDVLIGKLFDVYIPSSEQLHIEKLNRLRRSVGIDSKPFQIDSLLLTESGTNRDISWIHTLIKPKQNDEEAIVLTLGVDISAYKNAEKQMLKMATYDQLTGLSNRRRFQTEFASTLAMAERYVHEVALFYLDLDQFKLINDTCGHGAGDNLLRLVARVLKDAMRSTDLLCRIGGDEFTVIMPDAEPGGIESVAEKINEVLHAIDFPCDGKVYKISTSIGVAIYPQHGSTPDELLSNADLAMYQAKEAGGARHHIFSPDTEYQARLTKRLYWKGVIEKAIYKDQFILYFQPILDIKTNVITHYECLTRIRLDDGEMIMPGDFIPQAEELGLIGQIDRQVVKRAIAQHIKFKRAGKDYKLSVNLSGHSFNDTTIFDDITVLLDNPDVDPGKIIFEITETAAVYNFAAAKNLINKIKNAGCLLSLDDFGVGFSSFYYLKHLPVDYVKIDGSFIKHIDVNEEDKIFVRALTDISRALGKKIVAEFVESEEILKIIEEFGVDYAQGYFIGKPGALD